MNIIKPLEERIVNLTKSANGVRTTEEAELRQLDVTRGSRLPRQIVVVLAKAFGVQLTMNWDTDEQKFTTELDNVTWSSDFDYKDYGLDGEGIISNLSCSKCNAYVEVYLKDE